MNLLVVAVAGGLGAVCRHLTDRSVQRWSSLGLPAGLLAVNLLGSLLLGLLTGVGRVEHLSAELTLALGTGFCGGFTTFSTFSYEGMRLLEEGQWAAAARYVVVMVVAGLGLAAVGIALGEAWG